MNKTQLAEHADAAEQREAEILAVREAAEKRVSDFEGVEQLAMHFMHTHESDRSVRDRPREEMRRRRASPFFLQERTSRAITLPSDDDRDYCAALVVHEIYRGSNSESYRSQGLDGYGWFFSGFHPTWHAAKVEVRFWSRSKGDDASSDWLHVGSTAMSQDPVLYDGEAQRRAPSIEGNVEEMCDSLTQLEEAVKTS